MLYQRWLEVARGRRNDFALREAESGRRWTFGQLEAAGENQPEGPAPVSFPQGHSAQFVLSLLAAWRGGRTTCPLEPGQSPPILPAVPSECVHLKLTSATTGQPRLIAFTSQQMMADAANIVSTMGLRPEWPNLAAISLAHSYGFSNLVLPLLLHGIPLIVASAPLPEAVRRAAAPEPALTLPGVPALWRTWHEAEAIPSNVRLAISAGAPLGVGLEQEIFASRGLKIHNFYGSSECGGIAYDRTAEPRPDEACVGTALDNVALAVNNRGCLEVRSQAVGLSYLPEPAAELGRGLFQTSDLAEIKGGVVFLRGRASDLINLAGRKLAPETVESALRQHPAVRDCLVLGVPRRGDEGREVVAAVVVARSPVAPERLRAFLHDRLPDWQVPRAWLFVEELSLTARGKISRSAWRSRFLSPRAGLGGVADMATRR